MFSNIEKTIGISEADFKAAVFSSREATDRIKDCLLHCIKEVPSLEVIAIQMLGFIILSERERMDGGPGSGHFGHGGVPGERGGSAPGNGSREAVTGNDISKSYDGPTDIKPVLSAQGFDGLPKVVSQEEFDKAVKESGFIAQRTYAATSQEILDAYQDQLYNGEWYVECGGGYAYGKGMYCASDNNGELEGGVSDAMEYYRSEYSKGGENKTYTETMTLSPDARVVSYDEINSRFNGTLSSDEVDSIRRSVADEVFSEGISGLSEDEKTYVNFNAQRGVSFEECFKAAANLGNERRNELAALSGTLQSKANNDARKQIEQRTAELQANKGSDKFDDVGTYAAALGYDAINAEGAGVKGSSYTVILNRTKTVFLDGSSRSDAKGDYIISFQTGEDGVLYAIRSRKVIGYVVAQDGSTANENFDGGPGSGNHGHEGVPGQVGGSAPGEGNSSRENPGKLQSMTKRRLNQEAGKLYDQAVSSNGDFSSEHEAIAKMLDELPAGSTILFPETANYGEKVTFTKTEEGKWHTNSDLEPFDIATDSMSWDFLQEEGARPLVSKVAMTDEERAEADRLWKESYWRNQDSFWAEEESLTNTAEVKIRKEDREHAGDGTVVTAKDGTEYIKLGDTWYDKETGQEADQRKIGSGTTFTGDFFDTNFGLNGVSAEECARMREAYQSMSPSMQEKYEEVFRNTSFTTTDDDTSYYNERSDTIFFRNGTDADTILHECSHALDTKAMDKEVETSYGTYHITSAAQNMDKLFGSDKWSSDFEAMANVVGIKTTGSGWFQDTDESGSPDIDTTFTTYLNWASKYSSTPGFDCVSDAISALTQDSMGESLMYGGHSASYWQTSFGGTNASMQSREYWANYCELKINGKTDALNLLKQVTPGRYSAAEETYKEVFGDD